MGEYIVSGTYFEMQRSSPTTKYLSTSGLPEQFCPKLQTLWSPVKPFPKHLLVSHATEE